MIVDERVEDFVQNSAVVLLFLLSLALMFAIRVCGPGVRCFLPALSPSKAIKLFRRIGCGN